MIGILSALFFFNVGIAFAIVGGVGDKPHDTTIQLFLLGLKYVCAGFGFGMVLGLAVSAGAWALTCIAITFLKLFED